MGVQDNKSIYKHVIEEVFNKGNLAAADELIASDYTEHSMPPDMPSGVEGFKALVMMFRNAFPDLKVTIEDMIAEGDRVVSRQIYTGTHKGALFGIPPTGKEVRVNEVQIARIANGRVVEHWEFADELGLMQQLGVMPNEQEAAATR